MDAPLGHNESALDVFELCPQRLAFLACPIDFAVGPILDFTAVALLFVSCPFRLFTTVVQLLPESNQPVTAVVALCLEFVALAAQIVDLRLPLDEQLFQVGQPLFRALPSSHCLCRMLTCMANVQSGTGFQGGDRLALIIQHLTLARQPLFSHSLGQVDGLPADRPEGLRHLCWQARQVGLYGDWAAHSFRSRFVTEAGHQEVPLGEVMAMTDHRSVGRVMG